MSPLKAEVGSWRWTWIGIVFAVVLPAMTWDSPRYAVLFLVGGIAPAIALRQNLDRRTVD
jgi:hypothetical protein